MIIHSLRLRGFSWPFRDREVAIDFNALGDGLVALVGGNGQGKTHVCEASGPAPLYREWSSYSDTLTDHVPAGVRDARLELVFEVGGQVYRSLVQADPAFGGGRGKQEAYLYRADDDGGWTPVAGPLVREYDEAIARILPSREVFLASAFAAQGGEGGFFRLPKAARKDLFGTLLGLGHLQTLAEQARAKGGTAREQLEHARGRLAAAAARLARGDEVAALVAEARTARDAARMALEDVRAQLAVAERAGSDARGRAAAADERRAAATSAAQVRLDAAAEAQRRVTEHETALGEQEALLRTETDVRAAAAELPRVDAQLHGIRAQFANDQQALSVLDVQRAGDQQQRTQLLVDHQRLTAEHQAAADAAARVRSLRAVEAELADNRRALETASAELTAHDEQTPALEAAASAEREARQTAATLRARRAGLAGRDTLLAQIPGVPECGGCPLTQDARAAAIALADIDRQLGTLGAPDGTPAADDLAAHQTRRKPLADGVDLLRSWVASGAERVAALTADRALAAREPELAQQRVEVIARGTAVRDALAAIEMQRAPLVAALEAQRAALAAAEAMRAQLAPLAERLPAVAAARAAQDATTAALATARRDLAAAQEAAAAAAAALAAADAEASAAREAAERAGAPCRQLAASVRDAEHAWDEVAARVARLEGEADALADVAVQRAQLVAQESAAATAVADWALLEKALGRDGVQALEIDAAGPEVTALVNDLLATCYGPRFQLALETTAETKDGRQREVFDVRILDGEAGREATRGSGGEMALLETALRLALCLFNARRSGCELRTIWLDETTAALSPDNADRYVQMVRRAMALGGFRRCILVSHQERVWQQADVRILVRDGTAQVDRAA